MQSLADAGITTLRSDRLGTVVLRFFPGLIEVNARAQRWTVPVSTMSTARAVNP
jgi:hypothetical protein